MMESRLWLAPEWAHRAFGAWMLAASMALTTDTRLAFAESELHDGFAVVTPAVKPNVVRDNVWQNNVWQNNVVRDNRAAEPNRVGSPVWEPSSPSQGFRPTIKASSETELRGKKTSSPRPLWDLTRRVFQGRETSVSRRPRRTQRPMMPQDSKDVPYAASRRASSQAAASADNKPWIQSAPRKQPNQEFSDTEMRRRTLARAQRNMREPTYLTRLQNASQTTVMLAQGDESQELPMAWWRPRISESVWKSDERPVSDREVLPLTLESLITRAIAHSNDIRVSSDTPLIREMAVVEADAEFDWSAFMETKWNDISDPVGNTLTTGGPPRFNDHRWDYSAGLRRRNRVGGRFEVSQKYGHQQNNSIFFIPNPQGTARLSLSYTQPILRGAGRVYNTSLVLLAQIDSRIAYHDYLRVLQEQLLEVADAYWGLYLERGSLLQTRRSYERAHVIWQELDGRRDLDASSGQIVRAEAAVASRRSELARAETAVRNAESRIRALVNDPSLGTVDELELVPIDVPTSTYIPADMTESLNVSLRNRPEVAQALKSIKAACVRLNMSQHELLPVLDVVLETYASGLRGNSSIGDAFVDQFAEGAPSYTAGLQVELPLRNRAARARHQRRQLELRQLQSQFRSTVDTLRLEVEVAVRDVKTFYQEMHAKAQAMEATSREVDSTQRRWKVLPDTDRTASFMLEDLLTAQERLVIEEFDFLNAQVSYNVAMIQLKKAMGLLLQHEKIAVGRGEDGCLPHLSANRQYEAIHAPPVEAPMPPTASESPAPAASTFVPAGQGNPESRPRAALSATESQSPAGLFPVPPPVVSRLPLGR